MVNIKSKIFGIGILVVVLFTLFAFTPQQVEGTFHQDEVILIEYPYDNQGKGSRFDWENASELEITLLRSHNTKHFVHPNDPTKRVCILSGGLLHAFTDKGFQDIERELPNYGFPEGIVLEDKTKKWHWFITQLFDNPNKQYIMDLPSWGYAKVSDGGQTVRVYDKTGTSIFKYTTPAVIEAGKAPFQLKDKSGNVKRDVFDNKTHVDVFSGEYIDLSPDLKVAQFEVENNKLYFKVPEGVKYPLQAYDDTFSPNPSKDTFIASDTSTTNYGSNTILWVQSFNDGTARNARTLLEFPVVWGTDIPAGATLDAVSLKLNYYSKSTADPKGRTYTASRVLRTDWHETQSTWNIYKTSSNWTTAGCDSDGNDYTTTNQANATVPTSYGWMSWNVLEATKDARTATVNPIFRIRDATENSATQYWTYFYSKEAASNKPYLEITYTTAPTVTTSAATNVEVTTATGNGEIVNLQGGGNCTVRGFNWGTSSKNYTDNVTESGSFGTDTFSLSLTGLPSGTTVYYRAMATNTLGTGYGAEQTFLTKPAAPTNVAATDGTHTDKVVITWTKSTGATNYKVYRDGGLVDTVGDVATYDDTGADAPVITPGTATASDGSSVNEVVLTVSGHSVANGTTHTYKVKASNTTGDSADSSTDTGYRGTTALSYQWRVSAADADADFSNIGGATTNPYSYSSAPAPTITPGTADASDGTSKDHVVLTVSGHSSNEGAGRYYYCVISMSGASPQDTTHDRGYRGVGALTYQWYRSSGDSDADYSAIGGGTTNPYNDTGGVVEPDGRYYKCYLSASGAASQYTTVNRGYKAGADPPAVLTGGCTGFTKYEAVLNGTLIHDKGFSATRYGFDYGLTTAYGNSVEVTRTLSNGTSFIHNLTGLSPGTVYYYRAKIYSSEGWGYGSPRVFNTVGSPVLYEHLNTGQDATTDNITGNRWSYMQFTVSDNVAGSLSHTITDINLYLKRTGTPGTVTVSLRHATSDNVVAGRPTGNDIITTTFNGNNLSETFSMHNIEIAETGVEANQKYAIVVRALEGDASNYISWGTVSGGGLANAVSGYSADGGLTWVDESPVDALFEIWGNPAIDIESAKVFTGYKKTGDWLITILYRNVYTPYYEQKDSVKRYFALQLVDSVGNVKAQVACPEWDYKPGSIYLNAAQVIALTWGGTYYVRLQGLFTGDPYTEYGLLPTDWVGADLTMLDEWILSSADILGDYYDTVMTTYVADRGKLLNSTGGVIFANGITGLTTCRPQICQIYSQTPSHGIGGGVSAGLGEKATTWQATLGTYVTKQLTNAGTVFGVDGKAIGGWIIIMVMIALMAWGLPSGHIAPANILALPILFMGVGLRLFDWAMLAVMMALMLFLLWYNLWFKHG